MVDQPLGERAWQYQFACGDGDKDVVPTVEVVAIELRILLSGGFKSLSTILGLGERGLRILIRSCFFSIENAPFRPSLRHAHDFPTIS